MGCDIHFYVEARKDRSWSSADRWTHDLYGEGSGPGVAFEDRFYNGRNYDLFAILADVRNGIGFAGIDTGDGFNVIAPPRGLPADASPEVRAASEEWGCDGHSRSYFTVKELLDFDWNQVTRHRGWVGYEEYQVYKRNGSPDNWCGGVSGGGVRHVTPPEMEALPEGQRDAAYCLVKWVGTYADSCRHFLDVTIPKMRKLGSDDDVRAVFWFDN